MPTDPEAEPDDDDTVAVPPPIENRDDDVEGDDTDDHSTPADLLELHEVLEYVAAVEAQQ